MHKPNEINIDAKKISVIVPVYNAEKTLKRCIDSLVVQTHFNIEVILVDDGSKDSSLYICKNYEKNDPRVRVIHKENGGVSSARNEGLAVATGDYVMFCDSDDWVENDWVEELLKVYEIESLPICGYWCHYRDSTMKIVKYSNEIVKVDKQKFFLLKEYGAYVPWNKIFDLRIIKENELSFSTQLTLGEDELFVWQYLQKISGDIVFCGKALNHYTWPESSSLTLNVPTEYYKQCSFIFNQIQISIKNGAKCSDNAMVRFWEDCYWQYERAIKRVFQDETQPLKLKLNIVNKIMRSKEYKFLVDKVKGSKNIFMQYLCRRDNSFGLYCIYRIGKY